MHRTAGLTRYHYPRAALGLLLLAHAPIGFAVPISSEVRVGPSVSLSTEFVVADEALGVSSQGTTLDPLSASESSSVTDGNRTASAAAAVDASWTSADQGSVTFGNSWETTAESGLVLGNVSPIARFVYTFTADADGQLSVTFNVIQSFTPDAGGANGYSIFVSGFSSVSTGSGGTSASGIATYDLLGGTPYAFSIVSQSNLGGNISVREFDASGTFDWMFTPNIEPPVDVPEPGTLALMALGLLGLIGRPARRLACGRANP